MTAIAETESGKLSGDKSSVSLKTPSALSSSSPSPLSTLTSATTNGPSSGDDDGVIIDIDRHHQHRHHQHNHHRQDEIIENRLEIEQPYLIANSQLGARVTWTATMTGQSLQLKWCPVNCSTSSSSNSQCREKLLTIDAYQFDSEIDHLLYSCDYIVSIANAANSTMLVSAKFKTPSCADLMPMTAQQCNKTATMFESLPPPSINCSVLYINTKTAAAICTWRAAAASTGVDSYRLMYGRARRRNDDEDDVDSDGHKLSIDDDNDDDDSDSQQMRNIAISVGQRYVKTVLSPLRLNQRYFVQVQASTIDGRLGAMAHLNIRTKQLQSSTTTTSADDDDETFDNDDQTIIDDNELSLSTSLKATTAFVQMMTIFITLFTFLRLSFVYL